MLIQQLFLNTLCDYIIAFPATVQSTWEKLLRMEDWSWFPVSGSSAHGCWAPSSYVEHHSGRRVWPRRFSTAKRKQRKGSGTGVMSKHAPSNSPSLGIPDVLKLLLLSQMTLTPPPWRWTIQYASQWEAFYIQTVALQKTLYRIALWWTT